MFRVLVGIIVLLWAAEAFACGVGCSWNGARFGPDLTPDIYIFIGDVQADGYCDRYAPNEAQCVAKIHERAQETFTLAVAAAGQRTSAIVAVTTLGDQTEHAQDPERRDFRDNFVDWLPAWARAIYRHVIGNHDISSTCGKLIHHLDDPFLHSEKAGKEPTETYWVIEGRHSRLLYIPDMIISDFYAMCVTEVGPYCYGGPTDKGDPCTTHADCEHRCYDGVAHYAEFTSWYERQKDINADHPKVRAEMSASHTAKCRSPGCPGGNNFYTIENLRSCSAPDTGAICGTQIDYDPGAPFQPCPTSGTCTEDRVGFEIRDWLIAQSTDREVINMHFNGHHGGCGTNCGDTPYVDIFGTTDLLNLTLTGPWQAPTEDSRQQGAVITVQQDGSYSVVIIKTAHEPPSITSSASVEVPANTPTDHVLVGADPDYSSQFWTVVPDDPCITQSPSDTCCSVAGTFSACCGDQVTAGSLSPVMQIDCDAGTYEVDVTLNDGWSAHEQLQTVTVTVTP